MSRDSGITDLVGAILVVALIAGAVGIISVALISQPHPVESAAGDFELKIDSPQPDRSIHISHIRGDIFRIFQEDETDSVTPAKNPDIKIRVDGTEKPIFSKVQESYNEPYFFLKKGQESPEYSDYYSSGDTLVSKNFGDDLPDSIAFIEKKPDGSEYLLWNYGAKEIAGSSDEKIGVDFYAEPRTVCVGETVYFYDASNINANYWNWDFDTKELDPDTSHKIAGNEANPTHKYNIIGKYSVSLTAGNEKIKDNEIKEGYIEVKPLIADFVADSYVGVSPLDVQFTDTSRCNPEEWEWSIDGGTPFSTEQNPSYTFEAKNNEKTEYTVRLTVRNGVNGDNSNSIEKKIVVTPDCEDVEADFFWELPPLVKEPLTLQFRDNSDCGSDDCKYEINNWEWDFDDEEENATSENPTRVFEGEEINNDITLTVWNECGNCDTATRSLTLDCPNIEPKIKAIPESGDAPLDVKLLDITPENNLDKEYWFWSFGDGTTYLGRTPSTKNPPVHTYKKLGKYYVTLQVRNKCGQVFQGVKLITVKNPATIAGNLWNDKNLNQEKDPGEVSLTGWTVTLMERDGKKWKKVGKSEETDDSGNYIFNIDTSGGVYKVVETFPSQPNWKVTLSYPDGAKLETDPIVVYDNRTFTDVNFGNVDEHTSTIQIPGKFFYGKKGSKLEKFKYPTNFPFDVTTSYDSSVTKTWVEDNSGEGAFKPYISYTAWGNSSFVLIPGFYNLYYKFSQKKYDRWGRYIRTDYYWHWLDEWIYGETITKGFNFTVPDNTVIKNNELTLNYYSGKEAFFEFFYPKDGVTVPYSEDSYIEVHYVGDNEDKTAGGGGCYLIEPTPVSTQLPYDGVLGYNIGYWDNTEYEGEEVTLKARDTLTDGSTVENEVTAKVDWEPLTVTMGEISSDISFDPRKNQIKGLTTVLADVNGNNRGDEVSLVINKEKYLSMDRTGDDTGTKTRSFTCSFQAEDYAGEKISLMVHAIPDQNHGNPVNSSSIDVNALSRNTLIADFNADPWEGYAPLEVSFSDTSYGGPNKWNWNFDDGNSSNIQNPINVFSDIGTYDVFLQVWNETALIPVMISQNVNVTGRMKEVTLITTRNATLKQSGSQRWISQTDSGYITVNGTVYPVHMDDKVRMGLLSDHTDANIRISGGIQDFNVNNTSLIINEKTIDKGNCTDIEIPDMVNYHSNLTLLAPYEKGAYVSLIWDGVSIPINWKQNLEIQDLMPLDNYMNLDMDSDQVYFSGFASGYSLF